MTPRRRRLLTIGHSYCVALNRRLAHELARGGGWDVTAAGPDRFHGDFGWHRFEPQSDEACALAPLPVRWSSRVHVMLYGRRLRALLDGPWDLVHCWEEPYVAAAAQIARWTPTRVPLVFATFQNIAKRYPPPFNWLERYAMRRADGVIAFGRTTLDVLNQRGFGPGRGRTPTRLIPPGVDVSHFRPDPAARASIRRDLGWTDEVPVVGYLGRLVPEKGLATLTSALDRLATPWRALIVGAGPLEADLRAWSRRHDGRVSVLTTIGHDEVARYLNAMDLLCAPSQTTPGWREQFGRMLIEAFACGVPVVASDSGEIPYVLGDAGVIVGERDLDGWTAAIEALLEDRPRRDSLSRAGRQRALDVYDWAVVARQHLEFFDELVGAASRQAL